jgi:hypothetical protein
LQCELQIPVLFYRLVHVSACGVTGASPQLCPCPPPPPCPSTDATELEAKAGKLSEDLNAVKRELAEKRQAAKDAAAQHRQLGCGGGWGGGVQLVHLPDGCC